MLCSQTILTDRIKSREENIECSQSRGSATGFHNSLSVTVILKSDKHVALEGAESLLNRGCLS